MVIEEFLTIDYLKTFMGTVVVTMLMVQFLKELPPIKKISTKYFTFMVALFNIVITTLLTGKFKIGNLYIMIINAILVTFTATGGYDFTIRNVNLNNNKLVTTEKPKEIESDIKEIVSNVGEDNKE